jgi:tetratricopeptide (TPR) repeat protein
MGDRLRALWDFDDLDASERRLRSALAEESSRVGRAEVLTQLARVQGLRGSFDAGDELLDEAHALAGDAGVVPVRVALERGRLRRSSGDAAAALPLFEESFELACRSGEWFLAADAAHMAALASPGRDGVGTWTERGLRVAGERPAASYWAGPLLNNLGWRRFADGELQGALEAFEGALEARERDGDAMATAVARYAVGKTLRALGRADEAIPLLEAAVGWADAAGRPDGWFHEELAEEYAVEGRRDDASAQARLALPLLEVADPGFAADDARSDRLRSLAGDGSS